MSAPQKSSKLASRYAPLAQQQGQKTPPSPSTAPSTNVKVTKVTEIWKKDGSTTPRENTTPEQVPDTQPAAVAEPAPVATEQPAPKKRTYVRVGATQPAAQPVVAQPVVAQPAVVEPVKEPEQPPQQTSEPQQAEPQQPVATEQPAPKKRTYVRTTVQAHQPPKDSKLAPVITDLNSSEPKVPAEDHQLSLNQALKRKQLEAERLEDIEKQDNQVRKQLEQKIASLEQQGRAKDQELQEAIERIQQLSQQNQQLEEQVIQQATELDQLRSNGPEAANYSLLESISQKISSLERSLEKKGSGSGDQLLQQQKIQFEYLSNQQVKIQDTLNQQFQQMYDIIVLVQTQQVESENQQRQTNQTFEAMHSELKTLVSQRVGSNSNVQASQSQLGDTQELQSTIQSLFGKLDELSVGMTHVSSQSKTIEQLVETFTHNMIEQHQHYFKKQFDFLEQQWKIQKHENHQLHDDLLARIGNAKPAQRNFEPIKDEHHGSTPDQKYVPVQKPVAQKPAETKGSVKNLANQFANKPAETSEPVAKPLLTTTRHPAVKKNPVGEQPKAPFVQQEQPKQPEPEAVKQPEPEQEAPPKAPTPVEPPKAPTPVEQARATTPVEPAKAPTPVEQPRAITPVEPEKPVVAEEPAKEPEPAVVEQPTPVIEEPVKQPEPESEPAPVVQEPVKQPEPEQPAPKKNMFATLRSIKDKKQEQQAAPQPQATEQPAAPFGQGMLKKARRASTFNRAAQKTVEQKAAQQTPMFDVARSATTLAFTEGNTVVTNNKANTYGVATIAASLITTPPFNAMMDKKAVYAINYFEVEISKLADPDNLDISIALVNNKIKNTSYLGGTSNTYAFDLTGCTVHNEDEQDYGEDMYENDRIGMWLELLPKVPGRANVHFYKNGAPLGVAFDNVDVSQDTWYFALHMFYKDDSVKLITTAKHPQL